MSTAALVVAALAVPVSAAQAATFTVTKTADTLDGACDSDCSLREAISAANADATDDVVVVPGGVFRLERFDTAEEANAAGDLDVTADVTIRGAGPAATTILAITKDRVLDLRGAGTDLRLADLTVAGGHVDGTDSNFRGGGIRSEGTGDLNLERVVVRDNKAFGQAATGYGGGVYKSDGRFVARDVTFTENHATAVGYGGGLFLQTTTTTASLTNVTFTGNSASANGGAIYLNNAIVATLEHVTIAGNTAAGSGGGIAGDMSLVRLRSSVVAANTAPTNANCGTPGPASDGGNVGDPACGLTTATDRQTLEPRLDTRSGTAIPILEPLADSPALDAALGACPPADARGVSRPQGQGCDAGAAERPVPVPAAPAPPPAPTTAAPTPTTVNAPPGLAIAARATFRRGARSLSLNLGCPPGARCRGTVTLSARPGTRRAAVTIARRRYSLAAGRITSLRFTMNSSGRSLLRTARRATVTVTVKPTGAKTAQTTRVTVTRRR